MNKDECGLAEKLAEQLAAKGLEPVVVDEIPAAARHVIYFGVADERLNADQAYAVNYAAFAVARTVAASMEQHGGLFWTVQNTGGDFGLSGSFGNQPATAGLAALAKTAMKEWPSANVKAIDVDLRASADDIAAWIGDELFRGGAEREVGFIADGARMTLVLEPDNLGDVADLTERQRSDAAANADRGGTLVPYDVVLVSGGARGVTAQSLLALAGKLPLRYILLGRSVRSDGEYAGHETERQLIQRLSAQALAAGRAISPSEVSKQAKGMLVSREIARTIEQLERLGSQACYVCADVVDGEALSAALRPITDKWGPVRGIVHGAGVLADKRIADKMDESFCKVFRTKVDGFQSMLQAAGADNVRQVVIFSSVAAREGNVGQCDYAMANEVLNKMAQQLHYSGKAGGAATAMMVKALNWGPWAGGMVTPELERHFQSQGVALIDPAAGAACFAREVCVAGRPADEVEIVLGGGDAAAAPSLLSGRERVWRLAKILEPERHEWLDDHRIYGERVVPVVAVLEWFRQFVRGACPEAALGGIDNIRVLNGLRLRSDSDASAVWTVTGHERNGSGRQRNDIEIRLTDADGKPRYAANAVLAAHTAAADADKSGLALLEGTERVLAQGKGASSKSWNLAPELMYGGRLFHGPSFQVIDRLLAYSESYASALLSVKANDPGNGRFGLEPLSLLLDGGLQLARLWGYEMYGKPSLPMAIGSLDGIPDQTRIGEEPICCEVAITHRGTHKFAADIVWSDRHSRRFVRLRQVTMYFVEERQTR